MTTSMKALPAPQQQQPQPPPAPAEAPDPAPSSTPPPTAPAARWSARLRRLRRVIGDRRTTPGRLRLLRTAVVLACLVLGTVSVYGARDRTDATGDISLIREPLSADAGELYRSLADADATAASGFLLGSEPSDVRTRYEEDIARAATSLARVAGSNVTAAGSNVTAAGSSATTAGSDGAADAIGEIAAQLPVYTGLFETARANNRQGFPVAGAYLRAASQLMQSQILPAAEELHRIESARLDAEYGRAGSVPVLMLLAGLASLAVLGYAQVFLFRRTNRVVNVGLATASAGSVLVLLWWTVAVTLAAQNLDAAQRHSDSATDALGQARIAALQARSNESLALVARSGGGVYEQEFMERAERLAGPDGQGGLLGQALDQAADDQGALRVRAAVTAAQTWLAAHRQVRSLDDSGQYGEAIALAVGTDPAGSGTAFIRLDSALAEAVAHERTAFAREIEQGRGVLTGLTAGAALLLVVATVGAAIGIGQRLEEYR